MIQSILFLSILFLFSGCGQSDLTIATIHGDLTGVKKAIKNGDSVEDSLWGYRQACLKGYLDVVKYLSQKGIKQKDKGYCLLNAAYNSHFPVVKYLIEQEGIDSNFDDSGETTALMKIVEKQFNVKKNHYNYSQTTLEMMKFLLDHGARLSDLDRYNNAYYKRQTVAKYDLVRQYNQYIAKLDQQKQHKQLLVKQKNEKLSQQKTIEKYITTKDFQGLKSYTEQHPNSVYYIKDPTIRLLLTGPKGMKVGDIKKYIEKKKSELIIISLIKRVKQPYKEFTMQEIELLQKMGLSDKIIAAMIDVTTKLLDNEQKRKQQEFLLKEQERIAKQKTKVTYKYQSIESKGNSNINPIADKITDKLIDKGVEQLFNRLF